MKTDNLLVLLKSFSRTEMHKFIDFVASPYFNKRQRIIDFATYLFTAHPELDRSCLDLIKIPNSVLLDHQKTKKELSYIKSQLYSLAKQFVGIETVKKEPFVMDYYIAAGLTKKNNNKSVTQLKKLMQELVTYEQPRIQEMHMHFLVLETLRPLVTDNILMGEALLQASIDSLERLYFFSKIGQSYEVLNRKTVLQFKEGFRNALIDDIEAHLNSTDQIDPQVAVLFQLYQTSKHNKEVVYFDKLLHLLSLHHDTLNPSDLRGIYLATINLGLVFTRLDLEKYAPVTLNLYVEGIKSKALFEKGILSQWTYTNAIRLGLKLNHFEWVKTFIRENNGFLAPEERLNVFHANSAELAYAQAEYDTTLEHLGEVSTRNFRHYLNAQVLYIKVFYETDSIDSCLHTLAALKSYLSRRKEVAKALKKNYQLFSNILFRILMVGVSEKKRAKLADDLANVRGLREKDWLLSVFERECKGK